MRTSDLKLTGLEVGGSPVTFAPCADDMFTIPAWTPPPGSEPFECEYGDIKIAGHSTVCEVAPCVFVFCVYRPDRLDVQRVRVTLKEDSESIPRIRERCIAPTAEDMAIVAQSA